MIRGFTLVEMLVVITIVVILAGLGFGAYGYVRTWTAVRVTEGRVEPLGYRALGQLQEKGSCPASLIGLAPAINRPGWIEQGAFVDAWSRPLEYSVTGKSFRVRSAGPDGVLGTADDIEFAR